MIEAGQESPFRFEGMNRVVIQSDAAEIRAEQIAQLDPRLDGGHGEGIHRAERRQKVQIVAVDEPDTPSETRMIELDQSRRRWIRHEYSE